MAGSAPPIPEPLGQGEIQGNGSISADRHAESLLPHAVSLLNDLMATRQSSDSRASTNRSS